MRGNKRRLIIEPIAIIIAIFIVIPGLVLMVLLYQDEIDSNPMTSLVVGGVFITIVAFSWFINFLKS